MSTFSKTIHPLKFPCAYSDASTCNTCMHWNKSIFPSFSVLCLITTTDLMLHVALDVAQDLCRWQITITKLMNLLSIQAIRFHRHGPNMFTIMYLGWLIGYMTCVNSALVSMSFKV